VGKRLIVEHVDGMLVEQQIKPHVPLQLRVCPGLLKQVGLLLLHLPVQLQHVPCPPDIFELLVPIHSGHVEGCVEQRQGGVEFFQEPDRRVPVRKKVLFFRQVSATD